MGLFNKKDKNDSASGKKLPELPKLPALPLPPEDEREDGGEDFRTSAPKLPKFPDGYFGEKFSQNTIKEAVTGKKEEKVFADEFDSEDEFQTMHEPQTKEIPNQFRDYERKAVRETGRREEFLPPRKTDKSPIFIRIDKFEEGRDSLEKIKKQISEIGRILGDIKSVKEAERKEMEIWEREIQTAKSQIERIDSELFSKI